MRVVVATDCMLLLVLLFLSSAAAQDVRLVGGDSDNVGRVEVLYNGQWGTVCDDSWQFNDADAVCRQLGFERAEEIYYRAEFGEGTGPIWLDDLRCSSDANSILECGHNGWGVHNCRHSEDAAVKCKRIEPTKPFQFPVRLSCPRYTQQGACQACPSKRQSLPGECTPQAAVQGIVEAYYKNEWKPVSLEGWDEKSAQVVCNELGYPIALGTPTLTDLWSNWHTLYCEDETVEIGSGVGIGKPVVIPICTAEEIEENDDFRGRLNSTWLKRLDCTGGEGRLLDCYFREFGPNANPALQVATVRCGFKAHASCAGNSVKEAYRLRGGAVSWSGRLEVHVDGEWGTICDRDFDMTEANIACRALGYGSAVRFNARAYSGRGVGKIHYSALKCTGKEEYLSECEKYTGYRASTCGHQGDVSVTCNIPRICGEVKASRILSVPHPQYIGYFDDFVEVKGPQGWGLLCAGVLDDKSAAVVCKENKNLFSRGMRVGNHASYNGTRYVGLIFCDAEDEGLDKCQKYLRKVNSCPTGEVMLDCTYEAPDLVPDLGEFERSLKYYPYIDQQIMYYLTCALEENCLASSAYGKPTTHIRRLLRFSSLNNNWGTGDFRPYQDRTQWQWHACHAHFHSFEAFVHYDLLNKTSGVKVAEGHKASFCLEDSLCAIGGSRYRCGTGHQGISKNCGDLYGRHLDCQWIDITDVPPYTYQLRLHVNPDKLTPESDYRNNILSCDITFYPSSTYFTVANFKLSDH